MRPVKLISLIEQYDVLLFDAYGVLVHQNGAAPHAQHLVEYLNRTGKRYFLITNDAAKLPQTAADRYRQFGLEFKPEQILSCASLIQDYFEDRQLQGKSCAVLGTQDSRSYVQQAGGVVVPPGEPFEVLVVCDELGYPFLETIDTLLSSMFSSIDRGQPVHLVLPNPDLIYPKNPSAFGFTAGSVALLFEHALQLRYGKRDDLTFARLGKPFSPLFEKAAQRAGTKNMVMIGDQLATDILGANTFGIHSALVLGGVSQTAGNGDAIVPTYLLDSLRID